MATLLGSVNKVRDSQPLFATMVSELHPVEDKEAPTLGTDGINLYYNKEFLEGLNEEEGAAVVLHEVMHCAFQHVWRKGRRDQFKWNIATDYAINSMVEESFHLPKGCLLDSKYYGMSAEQIYERLPKGKKVKVQAWCDKDKWEDAQKGQGQSKNKGKGLGGKIKKMMGGGGDKPAEKPKERTPAEEQAAREAQQRWQRMFKDKILDQYGKLPDSIKRVIEKTHYVPVVDWQNLVANILSEDITDYSFSQPDRRYLESDFVLPDLYSIDKIKDVIFAYDTSGSIGDDDLHAFYEETMEIFRQFTTLTGYIAICDAYLHSFKEITQDAKYSSFNFQGGGGTAFEPVFDKIKKENLKPKAVFYFTDTYGSYPSDPGYPVFWLVRSFVGDTSTPEVPFGTVIKFLSKTR